MSAFQKIAQNVLTKAPAGPETTFGELWKDHRCVIIFFRRFGWVYCRLGAREVSAIKPILDQHDTKLIGVGLEKLGVEDFIAGNFFNGDLYVDEGKKSYSALGFKVSSYLSLFPAILGSVARKMQARAKALGLPSNMEGDGFQKGGALIVEKGGAKQLYFWEQQGLQDHASNSEILKALGIEVQGEVPTAESAAAEATRTDSKE